MSRPVTPQGRSNGGTGLTPILRYAGTILTSSLYVLSFPKFNQSYLAWLALIPLLFVLLDERPSNPWEAFGSGWKSGTLAYLGILYWLIPTYQAAHKSSMLATVCLVVLSAYLGLFWGLWAEMLARVKHKNPFLIALFGASAWVVVEYARTWFLSGFPWTLLADTQISNLSLIQIASITGAYGLSFLVVLINISVICELKFRYLRPKTRVLSYLHLAPLLLVLAYVWGKHELSRSNSLSPAGPPLRVALLQGSIDQYKKWDKAYVEEIQTQYASLVEEAIQHPTDLIIWPETSVPGYLMQEKDLREWLLKVVQLSKTNHLIGAPTEASEKAYNSSFSINLKGRIEGQYDKRHLVPFGEWIPLPTLLGRYIGALNDLGGFTPGTRDSVLHAAGLPVGVTICYEAIFPNLVRKSALAGAQLIVNQTNDGWYMQTAAPYQHWAPNIFRAIENRRSLLRADNTGISGIIDPWGRIVAASTIFKSCIVRGEAVPFKELTFYTRHGDLFAQACTIFCIAILGLVILGLL